MRASVHQEKFQSAIAKGTARNLKESRQDFRHRIREHATVDVPVNGSCSAEVVDVSLYGCCLFGPVDIVIGQRISIRFQDLLPIEGKVRWARRRTLGIEFLQALEPQTLESIRHHLIAG